MIQDKLEPTTEESQIIDKTISKSIDKLININKVLYDIVTKHKNKITYYHNNKSWDKFKKLSNEYELIFTTPNTGTNISEYCPVSRSFFKLWEILHDFNDIFFTNPSSPLKCLFLAEGPGGFAEAFIKYRQDNLNQDNLNQSSQIDKYYGITLKSNHDKNIPEWKITKELLKNMQITYGADNTGNLYNYCNIEWLQNNFEPIDFITADGGFDFSTDFNSQEELSFRLILCEILTALLVQKKGGTFILKVFDMFTFNTLKIIHVIKSFYDTVYIVKPLTSRPANSEKYLICTGFKGVDNTNKKTITLLSNLVKNYSEFNVQQTMVQIQFEQHILNNLISFNLHYSIRQVFYIQRTINYINQFSQQKGGNVGSPLHDSAEMNIIMNDHIRKSKKWCEKYNIPLQQKT